MKLITIAGVLALTLALAGCGDYLYKKNEGDFWKQATPDISKIIGQ